MHCNETCHRLGRAPVAIALTMQLLFAALTAAFLARTLAQLVDDGKATAP